MAACQTTPLCSIIYLRERPLWPPRQSTTVWGGVHRRRGLMDGRGAPAHTCGSTPFAADHSRVLPVPLSPMKITCSRSSIQEHYRQRSDRRLRHLHARPLFPRWGSQQPDLLLLCARSGTRASSVVGLEENGTMVFPGGDEFSTNSRGDMRRRRRSRDRPRGSGRRSGQTALPCTRRAA
jgi:hypothetical protein